MNIADLIKNYTSSENGVISNNNTGRILKQDTSTGYSTVVLSNNGTKRRFLVHRLVAEIYIPNNEGKPCVNHINGIKTDNRIENLEWVTYSENERHSHDILGKKIKHSEETKRKISQLAKGRDMSKAVKASADKRRGKPSHKRVCVYQFDLENNFIKKFNSLSEAAKSVNGVLSAFSALKRKTLKTYKGYIWKFEI